MLKTPILMNNTLKVLKKIVKQNTTLHFYESDKINCFMRLKL